MRITAGELKGRILSSPEGKETRPTSDRARQAVFNVLNHAGWRDHILLDDDAVVLDVFAGTGAMGIEALSQGAGKAIFIEHDRKAAAVCRENIEKFSLKARTRLIVCDATNPLPRPADIAPVSLVFLDPPYGQDLGRRALKALVEKDWLADDVVIVMEMAKRQAEELPDGFELQDERSYGVALVRFLKRV